jgi:hypothetical protein
MPTTQIRGTQINDGSIRRVDLNTSNAGEAVIRKVIAGTNISISYTGADAGTGDVTINASGGGGSVSSGTATLDFGSAPGTNAVKANITGLSGITSTNRVMAWIMGNMDGSNVSGQSTADHNAYEHAFTPIKVTAGNIVNGVGFSVYGVSELRLTGQFSFNWMYV